MCSTPLTFCSSGRATVSTRVLALAPGYRVVTCTVGGTTLGYCEVGNWMSATKPIRMKTNASTFDSTGLAMKKREIMPVCLENSFRRWSGDARLGGVGWIGRSRRQVDFLRIDLGAGKGGMKAFDPPQVTGIEPGYDDPKSSLALSNFHDLAPNNIVRTDHQDIFALLTRPDRIIPHQQSCVLLRDRRANPREQARQHGLVLVVEHGAHQKGAGRRVHLRRGVVHMPLVRIALLALQTDFDRNARQVRRPERKARLGVALLDRQNLRLAQIEIDPDRIGLNNGRELGRSANTDQRAEIDEMMGDDAIERSQHLRVAEVDGGEFGGRLGVEHVGGGLVALRSPVLHHSLAGVILLGESHLPLIFRLVVGKRGLI